jgi:hypothetical protein
MFNNTKKSYEDLIESYKKKESFSYNYKIQRNLYYNELKSYKEMQSVLLQKNNNLIQKYNNLIEQTQKILVPTQCKIKNYSSKGNLKSPIYLNNSNDIYHKLMNEHQIEIYNTVENKDINIKKHGYLNYDDIINNNKKLGLNFNENGFTNYKVYDHLSDIVVKFNFTKKNK